VQPSQADYAALGWDFGAVWTMDTYGYPKLQWQTTDTPRLPFPIITVGFNYGAIYITGSDGINTIYKDSSTPPNSVVLSAEGYTDVQWYVDGDSSPAGTGNSIALYASSYSSRTHSITFTGKKDGKLYSQVIPFTVRN
jgi:hypothetical protein